MGELFAIHAETNLTEFTSTATNGGDFSWSAAAALAGTSGGLSFLVNDSNAQYGYKSFAATGELRFRLYINYNSLAMDAGEYFDTIWLVNAASDGRYNIYFGSNEDRLLTLYATNDSGGWDNVGAITLASGTNCYVEFYLKCATAPGANNGIARAWVNGVLACEKTNIDNDSQSDDMTGIYFGKDDLSGTISGTFYMDEIVLRNDSTEIGPVAAAGGAIHRLVSPVRLGMLSGGGLAL